MKIIKNIAVIFLMMNIIYSSLAINIFIHACKSENIVDYSFVQNSSSNTNDCPYCAKEKDEHLCKMNNESHFSHGIQKEKTLPNITINLDNCCNEFTELIKWDIKSNSKPDVKIDLKYLIYITPIIELSSALDLIINSFEFLKHNSGISPPYEQNFIYFISSLLE